MKPYNNFLVNWYRLLMYHSREESNLSTNKKTNLKVLRVRKLYTWPFFIRSRFLIPEGNGGKSKGKG